MSRAFENSELQKRLARYACMSAGKGSLGRLSQGSTSRGVLINSLAHQQQNIPEVNEKEVTSALAQKTDALTDSASVAQTQEIRDGLYRGGPT